MHVCQEALELNGRLIEGSRMAYHEDLRHAFVRMEHQLNIILPEVSLNLVFIFNFLITRHYSRVIICH